MKSSTVKTLVIIAFLAALILPVIAADKVGGALSPNENRYLAKFPSIFKENSKIYPGLKNEFEAWLKDNLVGREQAQRAKAFIDFNVFSVSPSPLVHIGKEGWYFFTGDRNLEIGRGTEMLSSDQLMAIRTNQEDIQKSLKDQGIDYVLVLVPSKASVYPEYIGGGDFQTGTTLIDQVTAYLEENTTIPVINLKTDLVTGKAQQDVYFRTDTHWNHAGSYIGYETIIKRMNELGMIKTPSIEITTRPSTFIGDLSIMTGFPGLLPPDQYEESVIQNPHATQISVNSIINQVNKILSEYDINEECKSFSNISSEKKALILGDSYFFAWHIPQLLAENFSEMNFIRTEIFIEDIIQTINPDIVIFERTERYIYSLANPAAARFNP